VNNKDVYMCFEKFLLSSIGTVTQMWRNGTISTFNKQLTYSNLNNSHNYKKEKNRPIIYKY
ncbi:hypothetical protein, partial [Bacteroides fragilis]|uniref:hypothetical protein n=2 Tax=Bacteroides fragilis TaxID=817 RepID=UPI0022E01C01